MAIFQDYLSSEQGTAVPGCPEVQRRTGRAVEGKVCGQCINAIIRLLLTRPREYIIVEVEQASKGLDLAEVLEWDVLAQDGKREHTVQNFKYGEMGSKYDKEHDGKMEGTFTNIKYAEIGSTCSKEHDGKKHGENKVAGQDVFEVYGEKRGSETDHKGEKKEGEQSFLVQKASKTDHKGEKEEGEQRFLEKKVMAEACNGTNGDILAQGDKNDFELKPWPEFLEPRELCILGSAPKGQYQYKEAIKARIELQEMDEDDSECIQCGKQGYGGICKNVKQN